MPKTPVGFGIFSWAASERRSDRYGSFFMGDTNYDDTVKVVPRLDCAHLIGKRVKVWCKVVKARKSGHVGDLALKIFPKTPKVGEIVPLGVAILAPRTDDAQAMRFRNSDTEMMRNLVRYLASSGKYESLEVTIDPNENSVARRTVIMAPDDGRERFWIDPRQLYKLHDQTVELYMEETTEKFSTAYQGATADERTTR
jgi:hypothetical protein